jgi:anti-sigma factor RsiW
MINVYAWPSSAAGGAPPNDLSRNGYHFVTWRSGGIEYWAVSDLNAAELHTFVATFAAAQLARQGWRHGSPDGMLLTGRLRAAEAP